MYNLKIHCLPPFGFFHHQLVIAVVFPFIPIKALFAIPDAFVNHDPFQPAAKLNGLFQLVQVAESDNKSILQNIFSITAIPCHPCADIEHRLAVLLIQPCLRICITFAGSSHNGRLYGSYLFQIVDPIIRVGVGSKVGKKVGIFFKAAANVNILVPITRAGNWEILELGGVDCNGIKKALNSETYW